MWLCATQSVCTPAEHHTNCKVLHSNGQLVHCICVVFVMLVVIHVSVA